MFLHSKIRYTWLRNPHSKKATDSRDDLGDGPYSERLLPQQEEHRPLRSKSTIILWLVLPLSLFFNFIALFGKFARESTDHLLTYSPALPVIKYERVVFSSAFGAQVSPFQGKPSPENNKLWEGLYNFGISRVSAEEARPMDNKTLPIPGEEGGYIIQLAVFHQLHCLASNIIRKGIYYGVDMTNVDDLMGIEHIDHCIDMLRQSLMCSSDVTPLTFSRKTLQDPMQGVAEVIHTCRNFPQIQKWAWDRRVTSVIDKDTVVQDDPLGWGSYTTKGSNEVGEFALIVVNSDLPEW
ncbi:hypothetical protein B0T21DRAFT_413937 [Apiosordaria backusii]|uniref:Cyclochlorotine biosynthesis protein O n=1 Tax=Apiosordaria backusii TaxID=314023 RepID=A0AA40B2R9_9PEZI|nr:hypothetical protein B0T21DRAFT_413937 [Apiosordaria backusii]